MGYPVEVVKVVEVVELWWKLRFLDIMGYPQSQATARSSPPPKTSICPPPPKVKQLGLNFSLAHKLTNFCLYFKRSLPYFKKSGYIHIGSKFRGVAPQYLV